MAASLPPKCLLTALCPLPLNTTALLTTALGACTALQVYSAGEQLVMGGPGLADMTDMP